MLLVVCRYLDKSLWQSRTEFLCAIQLVDKSAEGMYKLLCAVLGAMNLPLSKMVALCTDGDSALIGRHNGLGARLRDNIAYILSVHCAAHKTALALADTAKNVDALGMLDLILRDVHNLFAKSPKRQAAWKRYAEKRGVTAFNFPVYNATRWFSRAQCVKVLRKNMPVLIKFLQKKEGKAGWEPAQKLLLSLTDICFVALLHAVEDVLLPVEAFRQYFERDGNLPHKAQPHVEACKVAFKELLGEEGAEKFGGSHLRTFLSNLSVDNIWHSPPGFKINLQREASEFTLEVVREFLNELANTAMEQLDLRFPESDVLSAFMIFDPESYRKVQLKDLESFGTAEFKKIVAHFCAASLDNRLFDVDKALLDGLKREFKSMKQVLWTAGQDRYSTFESVWRGLDDSHRLVLPHMLKFVEVCFVIPMNSCCAERGFSEHGVIKNKLRNRMRIKTVDALMRCRSMVDDYKGFDYQAAVKLYHQKPQGFLMPSVLQAVNALECGADTDSGDSADLEGDVDSVMAALAPAMYFESSEDESTPDEDAPSEDEDGLGEDADFTAIITGCGTSGSS